MTLPEAVWLLAQFDSATGVRRQRLRQYGDPFVAAGCAALLELLSIGSISTSGIGTVKYGRAVVYPTEIVPADSSLARAHSLILAQRKPRTATKLFDDVYKALGCPALLQARGFFHKPDAGELEQLTATGRQTVAQLRSDMSGEYGANLAAVIVRGQLAPLIFPDADQVAANQLRDRALAAPASGKLLLEALEAANTASGAV